jgi:hypothetical protein
VLKTFVVLAVLLPGAARYAHSQTSPALAPHSKIAPQGTSPASTGENPARAPLGPQSLSKEESLELENLQLKNALVQQQQTQLQKDFAALQEEVKRNHPGYQLIGQDLRPLPPPPPPQKPDVKK